MSKQMIIKICGIRTVEMAHAAVAAGADYVGLVFVPKSVRCVDETSAAKVITEVGEDAVPVGLFVDPDDQIEQVMGLINRLGLKAVQFHGRSDLAVDRLGDVNLFRGVAFDESWSQSLDEIDAWQHRGIHIAGLIADTPDPSGIGGGTGRTFDWLSLATSLAERPIPVPLFLAGGLNPDNVADAIAAVRPEGVDVSSGVESVRGEKDPARIKAFCASVLSASGS